jgi:hypothetical protein
LCFFSLFDWNGWLWQKGCFEINKFICMFVKKLYHVSDVLGSVCSDHFVDFYVNFFFLFFVIVCVFLDCWLWKGCFENITICLHVIEKNIVMVLIGFFFLWPLFSVNGFLEFLRLFCVFFLERKNVFDFLFPHYRPFLISIKFTSFFELWLRKLRKIFCKIEYFYVIRICVSSFPF